ncbi:ejaculatory bulb-specific protein 3-like [Rhynchophorus ferrugineus]|uniref:ejaculatory bulb-specific protein 3-like n=1 Tax=Rhynchophorus ferrugineus TaxID=354439 RepID=UPI003FCE59BC
MKSILLICFVVVLAVCYGKPADDMYTSKYDNVNLDEILNSDRLLANYMNCLLDKGKCTPEAAELKKNIPDALENGCVKCNEKQKNAGEKALRFLIENKRDYFDELEKKYDPEGKYRARYEKDIEAKGIKL